MSQTSLYAGGVLLMLLSASTLSQQTAGAADLQLAPVYVGGVTADMRNLADPTRSTLLRAAGGAFYAHESYILAQTTGTCPAQAASSSLANTIRVFANSASPLAEVGFSTPLALTQLMRCNFHAVGLHPEAALVDIDMGTMRLAAWQAFIEAGRAAGLRLLGPIVSPNLKSEPQDWNNSYWALAKTLARVGGALGMDTPPLLYRMLGDGYIRFARQQLHWCAENHIACIDIISPSNGESRFTIDSLAWARNIKIGDAKPTAWVVENYVAGSTPSIGGEREPASLTNSALILLHALPKNGN